MSKPIIVIGSNELYDMLFKSRGAKPVSVVAAYVPKMRVTRNPFVLGSGENRVVTVIKANKTAGMIGAEYDASVVRRNERTINKERAEQGLQPLEGEALTQEVNARFRRGESWHEPIVTADERITSLSQNKKGGPERYLRYVRQASGSPEYVMRETGLDVASERIQPFIIEPPSYDNQGLADEDKVRFNVWKLESIIEMAMDGERYRVSDNLQQYPISTRAKLLKIADEFLSGDRDMKRD